MRAGATGASRHPRMNGAPGFSAILEDKKRLRAVDLAARGQRGERYGQDATPHGT